MSFLNKLPILNECCGCVTDLRTATAIIAVLGIVTSPVVSWAIVRHAYVVRVSCAILTKGTSSDVVDIYLNNALSFGFGANAGLGASCLSKNEKADGTVDKSQDLFVLFVKYSGWIVLLADVVFLFSCIHLISIMFMRSDKKATQVFLMSGLVTVLLTFIYGLLYVAACLYVGGSFPVLELLFAFIDLLLWMYYLRVVYAYYNLTSLTLDNPRPPTIVLMILGFLTLYGFFANFGLLHRMSYLNKLPILNECCGCVTDLRTATAIIAVLGIVTSPVVSWAIVRHAYVVRVSCAILTKGTSSDVVDIYLNNALSFGFGANAGLGASCLSKNEKADGTVDKSQDLFVLFVKYSGWIVLLADVVFLFSCIHLISIMFKGSDKKATQVFLMSGLVSVLLTFIYGLLYVAACLYVGGSFPVLELLFAFIDLLLWMYYLRVVYAYYNLTSLTLDNPRPPTIVLMILGFLTLYGFFANFGLLHRMPCLDKLPILNECCGCVTDLRTATAIIAVLGFVTSPVVSWAIVRHAYVVRVLCAISTTGTSSDVVDIYFNNAGSDKKATLVFLMSGLVSVLLTFIYGLLYVGACLYVGAAFPF